MELRGVIRNAELFEDPPGSDQIHMRLMVQGVGPNQPRRLVIPYTMLLENEQLDPEMLTGRFFQASAEPDDNGQWLIEELMVGAERQRRTEEE